MSNSKLVDVKVMSPNYSSRNGRKIEKITIHHMAGNLTVETCGNVFKPSSRQASSHYGVDNKGRIGQYVDEKFRAWTSSSYENDSRAVTIEVANDGGASTDWHVSDTALERTIDLCVDICKRNGIKKLVHDGTPGGTLTRHNMFAATSCPGKYLQSKFPYICKKVNERLNGVEEPDADVLYKVQVGAYSVRANADAMLEKVKAAGFDTYMVQADGLYKIQVGAYSKKSNADAMLKKLQAKGFDTYITTKGGTAASTSKKTINELVKEVINGLWGNGQERVDKLKKAGCDPSAVQKEVNKILS